VKEARKRQPGTNFGGKKGSELKFTQGQWDGNLKGKKKNKQGGGKDLIQPGSAK